MSWYTALNTAPSPAHPPPCAAACDACTNSGRAARGMLAAISKQAAVAQDARPPQCTEISHGCAPEAALWAPGRDGGARPPQQRRWRRSLRQRAPPSSPFAVAPCPPGSKVRPCAHRRRRRRRRRRRAEAVTGRWGLPGPRAHGFAACGFAARERGARVGGWRAPAVVAQHVLSMRHHAAPDARGPDLPSALPLADCGASNN